MWYSATIFTIDYPSLITVVIQTLSVTYFEGPITPGGICYSVRSSCFVVGYQFTLPAGYGCPQTWVTATDTCPVMCGTAGSGSSGGSGGSSGSSGGSGGSSGGSSGSNGWSGGSSGGSSGTRH